MLQDLLYAILASLWFGVVFAMSVFLIGPTWGRRQLGFLLGAGVAAWMITFYPMAETFWAVVGTPK